MYLSYWQLNEKPFQNIQDTRFAFLSEQHREGLARLLYLVESRQLGGVLAGPYGVGKSMILELIGEKLAKKDKVQFVKLDVPPNGTIALARQISRKIGYKSSEMDLADALNSLEDYCQTGAGQDSRLVMALDEAHLLREDMGREFLRLVTNLRKRTAEGGPPMAAVTLLLAGHDELLDFVAGDPALSQRLHVTWRLEPLSESQMVEYVHFRVRTAGGDIWMFEEDALRELFAFSQGIPRVVNNVCDMALLLGQVAKAPKVVPAFSRCFMAAS